MCKSQHLQEIEDGLCFYHRSRVKKAVKVFQPPNPKSLAQAQKEKALAVLTKAHKAKFPFCQAKLLGCLGTPDHTHHMKGKVGKDYLDSEHFLSVCAKCHDWLETHPAHAKALGLSVSRLSNTDITTEV